jgi:SAM-dependent methyltransferase
MTQHRVPSGFADLIEPAARRYRPAGRFAEGFVRGKLRHDPVYAELLARPHWLPEAGLLLDLGCGRGILGSLLATAREMGRLARPELRYAGVELRRADAAAARLALGADADIVTGDLCALPFPECQAVVLLDVLLYLGAAEQEAVLERAAAALGPSGVLLMREADAGAGRRFLATRAAERLCALARGQGRQRYHYRSAAEWRARLEALGFAVETAPMSEGTPFANVLFLARRQAVD